MADTYTPNLNLVLPEVGSSRDTWGSKWNSNATILDQFVSQAMPIGAMIDFGGPNAPSGWLIADGRAISRTTYSALFAVLGTYWGAGDGSTTFNLPSPNGRASIGPGTVIDANGASYSYSFTQKAGVVTNVIAKVNLPNYNMISDSQGLHSHGGATVGAGAHGHTTDSQGYHNHDTGGTGGGAAPAGNHSHTGTTDAQGVHQHNVSVAYMNEGGNGVSGGGATTLNNKLQATDFAGSHTHNLTINTSGLHGHQLYADGQHFHQVIAVGDHAHAINADGFHAHNISLGGSGTPFGVLQPVLVVTKIIYAGQQAAVTVMGEVVPAAMASELAITDELATLRTELAELRAILMPPRSLRVLSSPSRGPH